MLFADTNAAAVGGDIAFLQLGINLIFGNAQLREPLAGDFEEHDFLLLGKPPEGVPLTYEALSKAGAPMFAYGQFITVLLNFLILAFIIFQMVRVYQRAKERVIGETPPPAPAPTPEDTLLLREIRDALKGPAR